MILTLGAVLAFLAQFSRGLVHLGGESLANQTVLWLKVHGLAAVVDECKPWRQVSMGYMTKMYQLRTSRTTTTEVRAHTEHGYLFLVCLVHGSELFRELVPRDIGTSRVDDIEHHLPTLQETVCDELAGTQGDGRGGILQGKQCQQASERKRAMGCAAGQYDRYSTGWMPVYVGLLEGMLVGACLSERH